MNTKIFKKSLNKNNRTINLKPKLIKINNMKYLPAFSKEWKNIIYSFNKNNMKNVVTNSVVINKIIKGYFNMFFKLRYLEGWSNFVHLKKRRRFLRRIFVSDASVKYTNSEAKITLYTINKEKKALKKKHDKIKMRFLQEFSKNFTKALTYGAYPEDSLEGKAKSKFISRSKYSFNQKYGHLFLLRDFSPKRLLIIHEYMKRCMKFSKTRNNLKKLLISTFRKQLQKYKKYLKKYQNLYTLNQYKFNNLNYLSKLTYLLNMIIGKKIHYNIINLKSITYHPDIFTDLLALKIKKERWNPSTRMLGVLHKARLLSVNKFQEKSKLDVAEKIDSFRDKYRDLKIVSHIKQENFSIVLNKILTDIYNKKDFTNSKVNFQKIHNLVFNSIGYKHLSGIKLKVSGRLTKRYRADRAVRILKWKGGLKNLDSSFKGLNAVSFRGNSNSNVSYSWTKSKRRIGSFAVKGWIGGK